jgi:hypothetical protein
MEHHADDPIGRLEAFVGEWSMVAEFEDIAPSDSGARVVFEWMQGKRFLTERWEVPDLDPLNMPAAVPGVDGGRGAWAWGSGSRPGVQSTNVGQAQRIAATHLPELDPQSRATVERVIDLILDVLPDAQHGRKWDRLTFTRAGDWHHWICAISSSKRSIKLVIHKGALLADPHGLMEGEGRYSRSIALRSPEQIDADVLAPILREAAIRQTEM